MNLRKINSFAYKLALALAFACASALSSLSIVQAKVPQVPQYPPPPIIEGYPQRQPDPIMMQGNLFNIGYRSGQYDAWYRQGFHPCRHQAYQQAYYPRARGNFVSGYLQGYFGGGGGGGQRY